jgi:hypothetical protein
MAMSLQSLPTQKNAKEAAIARLVAIGNAYIDYAIENPKVFGIAFLNRDDSTTTEYTELSWTLLSDSISELARTGVISPAKAKTVPLVLWSLVHGCASLLASGSLSTRETNSFKDSVVEGLLEFIKSEGRLEVPDLTSQ